MLATESVIYDMEWEREKSPDDCVMQYPSHASGRIDVTSFRRATDRYSTEVKATIARYLESIQAVALERRFQTLYRQWKKDTLHLSRMDKICMHPAYLQIIGIGPRAVPFVLRELSKATDYWFVALEALTGIRSENLTQATSLKDVADAWIAWGKRHGHI